MFEYIFSMVNKIIKWNTLIRVDTHWTNGHRGSRERKNQCCLYGYFTIRLPCSNALLPIHGYTQILHIQLWGALFFHFIPPKPTANKFQWILTFFSQTALHVRIWQFYVCRPDAIYLRYVFFLLMWLWPTNFKLYIKFPLLENIKILENKSVNFSSPLNFIAIALVKNENRKKKHNTIYSRCILMVFFSADKKKYPFWWLIKSVYYENG